MQGVWFRGWMVERARELRLTGWVRNMPDGRVAAVFEGEEADVRAAVESTRVGPSLARVADLQVAFGEATDEFSEFQSRY